MRSWLKAIGKPVLLGLFALAALFVAELMSGESVSDRPFIVGYYCILVVLACIGGFRSVRLNVGGPWPAASAGVGVVVGALLIPVAAVGPSLEQYTAYWNEAPRAIVRVIVVLIVCAAGCGWLGGKVALWRSSSNGT